MGQDTEVMTRRKQIENYVLGSLLSDPTLASCCAVLTPDEFTGANRTIYAELLRQEGTPDIFGIAEATGLLADILTLTAEWDVPSRLAHVKVEAEHARMCGTATAVPRQGFKDYVKALVGYAGR